MQMQGPACAYDLNTCGCGMLILFCKVNGLICNLMKSAKQKKLATSSSATLLKDIQRWKIHQSTLGNSQPRRYRTDSSFKLQNITITRLEDKWVSYLVEISVFQTTRSQLLTLPEN